MDEYGRSSNPITDTSSGIRIPASHIAFMAPSAIMSLSAKNAPGSSFCPARYILMSAYAPSIVGVSGTSKRFSSVRPALRSASQNPT